MSLDRSALEALLPKINDLDPDQIRDLLESLTTLQALDRRDHLHRDFMAFVKTQWPGFIEGRHHRVMAQAFERIAKGEIKRLMISMPPRHSKSEFGSIFLPAWYIGKFPDRKIIQASHTAELAIKFGRRVRNMLGSPEYQEVFPDVSLKQDAKASGRWGTNKGGEYYAVGVGSSIAGHGAHLYVIDDPHSEQDILSGNYDSFDTAYEWYMSGPRQRLQPDGAIIIICTRWSPRDLIGRLQKLEAELKSRGEFREADKWHVIEFPAILPSGKALWPEYWPLRLLEPLKAELPSSRWNAQYLQQPTLEEGSIVKREWWKRWKESRMPKCDFIITSYDTAYDTTERANPSACVTVGVFTPSREEKSDKPQVKELPNIMLLDAFAEKLDFPSLKQRALHEYKYWKPDLVIIEDRATGGPLISELRRVGIPIQAYKPTRQTGGKLARLNAVADLFAQGAVWAPETKFAEEVIDQMSQFPVGNDDLVDAMTQALLRFRAGGLLSIPSDEEDEWQPRAPVEYY